MNWDTVIVGIISLIGTLVGTLGGMVASAKLTTFRLEQLEKKVQAHNNLIERMYKAEGEITELQHDVKDLKNKE